MVLIGHTYTRLQRIARAATTVGLLLAGFFVLFFAASEKFPRANEALGGIGTNVVYAEAPSDSCDSCGCDGDCGN